MVIERIEIHNAADLIAAIEKMTGGPIVTSQVYLYGDEGAAITLAEMEQETLSDGSVVFNLWLSSAG